MSHEISINVRLLKAVACATGKEETRYYLKGVHVEFFADHLTLTATDGRKLIAGRQTRVDTGPGDSAAGEPGVILPLEMVEKIKLGRKAPDYATLSFDSKGDNLQARFLQLKFDAVTLSGFEVEATYPMARKVCPQTITGESAAVDPEIMMVFSKAAKLAGVESTPVIHQNGLDPALVSWLPADVLPGCKAFGVAMPMRVKGEYAELPEIGWVTGSNAYRKAESPENFQAESARLKAGA